MTAELAVVLTFAIVLGGLWVLIFLIEWTRSDLEDALAVATAVVVTIGVLGGAVLGLVALVGLVWSSVPA